MDVGRVDRGDLDGAVAQRDLLGCVEAGTRCRPRHGLQPAADDGASTPASLDAAADPDPKVETRTEWQSLVGWISCFCSWPWFSSSLLAERLVVGRVDCAVGASSAVLILQCEVAAVFLSDAWPALLMPAAGSILMDCCRPMIKMQR